MYDLIIIGSGPAGLTASIYASCYHLSHIVIGNVLGGQLILAPDILNYPGFGNISGKELTNRMVEQVRLRGGEVIVDSVFKIRNVTMENVPMQQFEIETKEGKKYSAKAVTLATGTERRKLNVPGEVEYTSRGVHYCATCEKFDYAGKICAVVGGANSALQSAVQLAQAASHVYIIYRGTELRGDAIWLEQVEKNPKIETIYNTVVSEIIGDGSKVTGVKLKSTKTGFDSSNSNLRVLPASRHPLVNLRSSSPVEDNILKLDKVFIEIGGVPGTALVIPLGVKMDPGGFIHVDEKMATNVPGIFGAGDMVSYGLSIEQISSAVGLGARAAASAFAYLKNEKTPSVWGSVQIRR